MANIGKLGKPLKFKLIKADNGEFGLIDDLIVVDVYEGYHKLGRFKLSDAKLKFR